MSPPVGPTGLALECGAAAGDDRPARFRAGADFGAVRTTLGFTGNRDAALEDLSAVARLELMVRPRWTVFAGAGSMLGGTVRIEGADYHMEAGWLATAGVSWLAVRETARRPFVLASAVLGYAATHTRQGDADARVAFTAGDGRLGIAAGKSFRRARPYLVGRAFAGPVSWQLAGQSIAGQDRHHYQLGVGAAFALPAHVDVAVEVVPIGEQGLVLGAGIAF